ncbi:hypothetical protein CF328_g6460 [Tilletia controversa]|nr:hypothetical protein CF328_g6460 [Tilletia controversa]
MMMDEEDDDNSEEEGVVKGPGTALALSKSVPTSGVNTTNATGARSSRPAALPPPSHSEMSFNATPVTTASSAHQPSLQRLITSLKGKNENDDSEGDSSGEDDDEEYDDEA